MSLATAAIGCSRLWVAHQNQRAKNVCAAPPYVYAQKWRNRSLRAQARATLRSLRWRPRI